MNNGWHITESDINLWADIQSREAQEKLPLLVCKLILASINPSFVRIPSGNAVLTPGWDGDIEVKHGNLFVPAGLSVWEFSTSKDIKGKADEDYAKRTKDPRGVNPKEAVYICLSSRIWPDGRAWQQEKNSEGHWKEVRVIDAVILNAWLHACAPVHRWFARLRGKRPEDAIDIEQAWDTLRHTVNPPLNFNLIIAGRTKSAEELVAKIKDETCIVRIFADSILEAYAFSLACILNSAVEYTPRVLVINDPSEWISIMDSKYPLILIPSSDSQRVNIGSATEHGHLVIIPESGPQYRSLRSQSNRILLPNPSRENLIEALVELEMNKETAEKIVRETKGFLMPLLRHEGLNPQDFKKPEWATREHAPLLIAALLIGAWDDTNVKDQGKIEKLSGLRYNELIQTLHTWSVSDDPPVRKIGNTWQVTSRQDLWQLLSPFITEQILKNFEDIAEKSLQELDPRYELKLNERWLANLHKKNFQHSSVLRKSVAEILPVLAVQGDDDLCNIGEMSIHDRISICARKILLDNTSAHRWYSLRDLLPYIAEASPEVFLEAVERGLEGEQPTIMDLFREEGNFGGCPHAGLLWALESISWNIEMIARVILIFAKLARLDPGGNWVNRPFESLRLILSPALPQTKVGVKGRLDLLDSLLSHEPEIGWKLLLSLAPKSFVGLISQIYKPFFREWYEGWEAKVQQREEYNEYTTGIYYRLITHAKKHADKCLLTLTDTLFSQKIPQKIFDLAIENLQTLPLDTISQKVKCEIHEKLRDTICVHKKFADAKWVMHKKMIVRLEEILQRFTPDDPIERHKYLFDGWNIDVICGPDVDFKANEAQLKTMRISALEDIWQMHKQSGIVTLIQQAQVAYEIGTHLAITSFVIEIENFLLELLNSKDKNLNEAARAFVYMRSTQNSKYMQTIFSMYKKKWDTDTWVNFCLGLPFRKETFDLLKSLSEQVKKLYWKNVSDYCRLDGNNKEAEWAIRQLLDNDRPISALNAASHYLHTIAKQAGLDANLLTEILEKVATNPKNEDPARMDLYKVGEIFKYLQQGTEIDRDRLIQLEWIYIEAFQRNKYDIHAQPITLVNEVLENPIFFVNLISWAYKADPPIEGEFPDLSPEERKLLADRAYCLLNLIHRIPGRSEKGDIDSSKLRKWVELARDKCKTINRLSVCDIKIGGILSFALQGDDDIWPHPTVRILFEEIESTDMEHGFEVGVYNLRGTSYRPYGEGGVQERKLAESYSQYADKIRYQSPRTAALLKRIARGYNREAKQEDLRVKKNDLI